MVMSRKFRVIGLLCILIIGNLSAQEQANQVNEKGQRTGLWLGYFKTADKSNGDIIIKRTSWTVYKSHITMMDRLNHDRPTKLES